MTTDLDAWFDEHIPAEWFSGRHRCRSDRDEILVVGRLDDEADLDGFRESTREARVVIAQAAEAAFDRKVSWAVRSGDLEVRFTTTSVPVMTRLRLDERQVLDTLIAGGVARSRSEALAWCVRLVGRHERDWIEEMRAAAVQVAEVRRRGPDTVPG
jgi:hypothetical protein